MSRVPKLDAIRESALLAEAREGDAASREAAFNEILRTLHESVYALCRNITRNSSDAEDALQEVFLSVHRNLRAFRGEARLSTWVYRIAIRSSLRVRARRPPTEPLVTEPAAETSKDPVISREDSDRLAHALNNLSADHRSVLSLFAVEGLSHRQIAETLGIPEGTVWSRLHQARKRLSQALANAT